MKLLIVVAIILATVTVQGCATKSYGRQETVTDLEMKSMGCREINLDLAQAEAFIAKVHEKSAFSGMDMLALLIDFGIGNHLEKTTALASANTRIAVLHDMRATKKCGGESGYE